MQAFQLFRSYPDTRSFFAAVSRAVSELDYWRMVAEEGADALSVPSSGHGTGIGDPTTNRAIWLADNDPTVRSKALKEVDRRVELIGAGLVLIASVGKRLGEKYADALDAHYIDGLSYRLIAEDEGVTKSAVSERIAVACDWCDSQPLTVLFKA